MSWVKKFWRGDVPFWQIFWPVLALLLIAAFFYARYISQQFLDGMTSYEDFVKQQLHFHITIVPAMLLWLVPLSRGLERAQWRWAAWLAVAFAIFNIFTAVYNTTFYAYHGHSAQVTGNDFDAGEGV